MATMSGNIGKKRKHAEDAHADPRYGGPVGYSSSSRAPSYEKHSGHEAKRHHRGPERDDARHPTRKRKSDNTDNYSDTGADVGETETDPRIHHVSHAFNDFNASLANLLALTTPGRGDCSNILDSVLGKERAAFVRAMRSMQREGSIPWLCNARQAPSPSPESTSDSRDGAKAPKQRALSNGSKMTASTAKTSQSNQKAQKNGSSAEPEEPPRETRQRTASTGSNSSFQSARSALWPPRLPRILNDAIRRQVFTHKSCVKGSTSQIGAESTHNERLEFLGDSVLNTLITKMIFTRFTNLREGPLSKLRSSCVSNSTLCEFAKMYDFDDLIITDNQNRLEQLLSNPKILADVFEAYIGGLVVDTKSGGEPIVDQWLRDLFEPSFNDFAKAQSNLGGPLDKSAKNTLQSMIGGKNVEILYDWVGGQGGADGGYEMALIFTGWGLKRVELGRGWATNKADASTRAAMNIIKEKTQLDMVKTAKKRFYEELEPEPSEAGTTIRHNLS